MDDVREGYPALMGPSGDLLPDDVGRRPWQRARALGADSSSCSAESLQGQGNQPLDRVEHDRRCLTGKLGEIRSRQRDPVRKCRQAAIHTVSFCDEM